MLSDLEKSVADLEPTVAVLPDQEEGVARRTHNIDYMVAAVI